MQNGDPTRYDFLTKVRSFEEYYCARCDVIITLLICLFVCLFFQAKELATLYKLRQLFVKDLQARLKVVR